MLRSTMHRYWFVFLLFLVGFFFLKEILITKTTVTEVIHDSKQKGDCVANGVLQSGGFCLDENNVFAGGNSLWDGKVCATLEDLFGHATVGDFGAGLGHYGSCFLRSGGSLINTKNEKETIHMAEAYAKLMKAAGLENKPKVIRSWEGFDGALNIEKVSGHKIRWLNLAVPQNLGYKFDWVMSLEVGEHIPKEQEATFIDNLVAHACKGIVLSWAVPGQGGYKHINNQPNDYVIQEMSKRGLTSYSSAQTKIRSVAELPYFRNTIMVFKFPTSKC